MRYGFRKIWITILVVSALIFLTLSSESIGDYLLPQIPDWVTSISPVLTFCLALIVILGVWSERIRELVILFRGKRGDGQ